MAQELQDMLRATPERIERRSHDRDVQPPGHRGHRDSVEQRLRGLPAHRRMVAAPAHVHGVRSHRLLRQLAQPPRHRALTSTGIIRSSAPTSPGRTGGGATRTSCSSRSRRAARPFAPLTAPAGQPATRTRGLRTWRDGLVLIEVPVGLGVVARLDVHERLRPWQHVGDVVLQLLGQVVAVLHRPVVRARAGARR